MLSCGLVECIRKCGGSGAVRAQARNCLHAAKGPPNILTDVRSSAHDFPIEMALEEGRPPRKKPIFWLKSWGMSVSWSLYFRPFGSRASIRKPIDGRVSSEK